MGLIVNPSREGPAQTYNLLSERTSELFSGSQPCITLAIHPAYKTRVPRAHLKTEARNAKYETRNVKRETRNAKLSDGAAEAEFAHAGLQGGALEAEEGGGAAGSGDAPVGKAEGAEDVLALGFFEGGDGGIGRSAGGGEGKASPKAAAGAGFNSARGTRSSLPGERSTARSMRFSSSRMLPGQE